MAAIPPNHLTGLASIVTGLAPQARVTHIRLSSNALRSAFASHHPSFEHIDMLAGPGWVKTRQEVIADMDRGWRYYVDETPLAPRVYLEIIQPTLIGARYVRTTPDCTPANNLLNLPRF